MLTYFRHEILSLEEVRILKPIHTVLIAVGTLILGGIGGFLAGTVVGGVGGLAAGSLSGALVASCTTLEAVKASGKITEAESEAIFKGLVTQALEKSEQSDKATETVQTTNCTDILLKFKQKTQK